MSVEATRTSIVRERILTLLISERTALSLALLFIVLTVFPWRTLAAQQANRAPESIAAASRTSAARDLELDFGKGTAFRDSEGPVHFGFGPLSVIRRSELRWVVLAGHEIHAFDSGGRLTLTLDQRGSGPGEYRSLYGGCAVQSDSIVVYDGSLRRFSLLAPDLKFHRTIETDRSASLVAFSCLNRGQIVVANSSASANRRLALEVSLLGAGPTGSSAIARFDGGLASAVARPVPSIVAWGEHIYVAAGVTNEIRDLTRSGVVRRIIRMPDEPAQISARSIDLLVERLMPLNASTTMRDNAVSRIRSAPLPTHWPAHGRMLSGDDGSIWIEDFRTPEDSSGFWTEYDADWKLVGRARIPVLSQRRRLDVLAFSRGHVLVWERTAEGESRIVNYWLRRLWIRDVRRD